MQHLSNDDDMGCDITAPRSDISAINHHENP